MTASILTIVYYCKKPATLSITKQITGSDIIIMKKIKGNKTTYLYSVIIFLCVLCSLPLHNKNKDIPHTGKDVTGRDVTDREIMSDDIAREVLRLHILANSDADYDQQLKLKVKSAVASAIAEDMEKCGIDTKDKAVQYIKDNSERYIALAKDVTASEGYGYDVTATIGRHWFPVKIYGNAVYPEGEYDAYRILIGSARGKNWWCVLFPSLCMVDEACHVENESDSQAADSRREQGNDEENNNIQFEFGIIEWFKNMW